MTGKSSYVNPPWERQIKLSMHLKKGQNKQLGIELHKLGQNLFFLFLKNFTSLGEKKVMRVLQYVYIFLIQFYVSYIVSLFCLRFDEGFLTESVVLPCE